MKKNNLSNVLKKIYKLLDKNKNKIYNNYNDNDYFSSTSTDDSKSNRMADR